MNAPVETVLGKVAQWVDHADKDLDHVAAGAWINVGQCGIGAHAQEEKQTKQEKEILFGNINILPIYV